MSNIPGPQYSYCDIIDAYRQKQLDSGDGKYMPIRPSGFGKCGRAIAYGLMEYRGHAKYDKKGFDPRVSRLLSLGHSVEFSAIREFNLVKVFDVRYKQVPMTMFKLAPIDGVEQELIQGSLDLALIFKDADHGNCFMDIKSAKDAFDVQFKTRWDEILETLAAMECTQVIGPNAFYIDDIMAAMEEWGDNFVTDNIVQLNAYCTTDFAKERNIDHGVIYKYNKNDSRHYEIRFKPSDELAKQIEAKMNHINESITKHKDPSLVEKDFNLGSIRCAYCPFRAECWDGENALKEWWNTLPPKRWPTRVHSLANSDVVSELFDEYERAKEISDELPKLENELVTALKETKTTKVELDNGNVYKVKRLKESIVIRKTKK